MRKVVVRGSSHGQCGQGVYEKLEVGILKRTCRKKNVTQACFIDFLFEIFARYECLALCLPCWSVLFSISELSHLSCSFSGPYSKYFLGKIFIP